MNRILNITSIFFYITLLMLIIGISSVLSMLDLGSALDHILRDNIESVRAAERMCNALDNMKRICFTVEKQRKVEDQLYRIEALEKQFMKSYNEATSIISEPTESDTLTRIIQNYQLFLRDIRKYIQNDSPNMTERERVDSAYTKLINDLDKVSSINYIRIVRSSNDAKMKARNRSTWIIFLTVIGFISSVFLYKIIQNRFNRPIRMIIKVLQRVIHGHTEISVPRSEGQVGDLAELINLLIEQNSRDTISTMNYVQATRNLSSALLENYKDPAFVFDIRNCLVQSNSYARMLLNSLSYQELIKRLTELIKSSKSDDSESELSIDEHKFKVKQVLLNNESNLKVGHLIIVETVADGSV